MRSHQIPSPLLTALLILLVAGFALTVRLSPHMKPSGKVTATVIESQVRKPSQEPIFPEAIPAWDTVVENRTSGDSVLLNLAAVGRGEVECKILLNQRHEDGTRVWSASIPGSDGTISSAISSDGTRETEVVFSMQGVVYSGKGRKEQPLKLVRKAIREVIPFCPGPSLAAGEPKSAVKKPLFDEGSPAPAGESAALTPSSDGPWESLPGAANVFYLDFDGETVTGTGWNATYTGGAPIVAQPSPGVFQRTVWGAVAEDFRPFSVNVTTDRRVYDATPAAKRMMCIYTLTDSWYPNPAAGVTRNGSFGSALYPVCWVFGFPGGNQSIDAGMAGSHELGHALGLDHDGTNSPAVEYYGGYGGLRWLPSWGPIMGAPYGRDLTQWSRGEYPGANNQQDDTAIIAARLGRVPDDVPDVIASAAPMTYGGRDTLKIAACINTPADVDVFKFSLREAGSVRIRNLDGSIAYDPYGEGTPNAVVITRLLDSSGVIMASVNPYSQIDRLLSAGDYFLRVESTGDPSFPGYSNYGSLGGYAVELTLPAGTGPVAAFRSGYTYAGDASGQFSIGVSASVDWTVSRSEPWVHVKTEIVPWSPYRSKDGWIELTLDANTGPAPRTSTLKMGDRTHVITQEGQGTRTALSWTPAHGTRPTGRLNDVVWNGEQFIAVGGLGGAYWASNQGLVMASADGKDWWPRSLPPCPGLNKVCWSGQAFIAVGGEGTIITSPDGMTWSLEDSGTTDTLTEVAATPEYAICKSDVPGHVYEATDYFHSIWLPYRSDPFCPRPASSSIIRVRSFQKEINRPGGIRVVDPVPHAFALTLEGKVYGITGSCWNLMRTTGSGPAGLRFEDMFETDEGVAIIDRNFPTYNDNSYLHGVFSDTVDFEWRTAQARLPWGANGDHPALACGTGQHMVWARGETWGNAATPKEFARIAGLDSSAPATGGSMPGCIRGLAWSGSRYVLVGDEYDRSDSTCWMATSTDGTTWEFPLLNSIAGGSSVESSVATSGPAGTLAAVTGDGTIAYSRDGTDWERTSANARKVVWTGRGFIAPGNNRILHSTTGFAWTEQSVPGYWIDAAASGDRIMVTGYANSNGTGARHATSPLQETPVWTAGDGQFTRISRAFGGWMAGNNNGLYSSTDGTAWTLRSTLLAGLHYPIISFTGFDDRAFVTVGYTGPPSGGFFDWVSTNGANWQSSNGVNDHLPNPGTIGSFTKCSSTFLMNYYVPGGSSAAQLAYTRGTSPWQTLPSRPSVPLTAIASRGDTIVGSGPNILAWCGKPADLQPTYHATLRSRLANTYTSVWPEQTTFEQGTVVSLKSFPPQGVTIDGWDEQDRVTRDGLVIPGGFLPVNQRKEVAVIMDSDRTFTARYSTQNLAIAAGLPANTEWVVYGSAPWISQPNDGGLVLATIPTLGLPGSAYVLFNFGKRGVFSFDYEPQNAALASWGIARINSMGLPPASPGSKSVVINNGVAIFEHYTVGNPPYWNVPGPGARISNAIFEPGEVAIWANSIGLPPGKRMASAVNGPLQQPNLLFYVMGINPLTATPGNLPQVSGLDASRRVHLRYYKARNLPAGYSLSFETSTDLENWEPTVPESNTFVAGGSSADLREAVFPAGNRSSFFVRAVAVGSQ